MFPTAIVNDGYAGEAPLFIPLLEKRPKEMELGNIAADPGIPSRINAQYVADNGGVPYLKPKKNVEPATRAGRCPAWKNMVRIYYENKPKWKRHYNPRAIIEAMFRCIKKRFGETVSSRRRWRQKKEILLKIAAYNALRLGYNLL
jgi:hypothetical protein